MPFLLNKYNIWQYLPQDSITSRLSVAFRNRTGVENFANAVPTLALGLDLALGLVPNFVLVLGLVPSFVLVLGLVLGLVLDLDLFSRMNRPGGNTAGGEGIYLARITVLANGHRDDHDASSSRYQIDSVVLGECGRPRLVSDLVHVTASSCCQP